MDNFIENSNSKGNDEISLVKYINIIKYEKRLIIFLVIIGSLIGAGYSLIKKPVWQGNFKVVVEDKNKSSSSNRNLSSSLNPLVGLKNTGKKQTKLEILKSPYVLKPVYEFAKNYDQAQTVSSFCLLLIEMFILDHIFLQHCCISQKILSFLFNF